MYCTGFARRAIKMKVQNYTRKLCIEKKNTEYLCLHDQIEHFFSTNAISADTAGDSRCGGFCIIQIYLKLLHLSLGAVWRP